MSKDREQKLKKNYGLSIADYNAMLEKQKGKCLVCGQYRKLVVDHCHEKGHVRGLLCSDCNAGLGFFRDNPTVLQTAITYLKERTGK